MSWIERIDRIRSDPLLVAVAVVVAACLRVVVRLFTCAKEATNEMCARDNYSLLAPSDFRALATDESGELAASVE